MIVGYLPHAFDMFNVGHVDLIKSARGRVDRLVVAVMSDDDVLARNGRPPVVPLTERLEILRHVRGVDEVRVLVPDDVPPGAKVLVPPGDECGWLGAEVLPLVRTSASNALNRALRAVPGEAVA